MNPQKGDPKYPVREIDRDHVLAVKSRLGSICPEKLLRITTISAAAGKILSQDLPRMIETLERSTK